MRDPILSNLVLLLTIGLVLVTSACGSTPTEPTESEVAAQASTMGGEAESGSQDPAEQAMADQVTETAETEHAPEAEPSSPSQPQAALPARDLATHNAAPALRNVLTPVALAPVPRAAQRTAQRLARNEFERRGRVLGALPNGTILVALPMPSEMESEEVEAGGVEDACSLTEIAAINDEGVVGSVRGVCADGDNGAVLSGDVDGDGVAEFAIRTRYTLYTDFMSRAGAGIEYGVSTSLVILDEHFEERVTLVLLVEEEAVESPGITIAIRVGLVDMNADGNTDFLVQRRDREECPDLDIWASPEEVAAAGEYDNCGATDSFDVWLMDPETRRWEVQRRN